MLVEIMKREGKYYLIVQNVKVGVISDAVAEQLIKSLNETSWGWDNR